MKENFLKNFFLIAGPCVIESESFNFDVAARIKEICNSFDLDFVFKSSFDKANRSAYSSFRGPGLEDGLMILKKIKTELDIPVLSDVHSADQVSPAADVLDMLQSPAFLCRQTDFIAALAAQDKPVNIKKGQFLSPFEMKNVIEKARFFSQKNNLPTDRFFACERGFSFGYGDLVVDMRSLVIMRSFVPVIFDATHSVQQPGKLGSSSGGQSEFITFLARAAAAVGIDGIFIETHPDPDRAYSDGPNALKLKFLPHLIEEILEISKIVKKNQLIWSNI